MKLSDFTAKLTNSVRNLNSTATRALGIAALAGAALATVPVAQAQHFAVGVQFGGPRYYAPAPPQGRFVGPGYGYGYGPVYGPGYDRGYWQHRRFEDWRRHEYFEHRGYRPY